MEDNVTRDQIKALSDKALKSIIATTNPTGSFAAAVVWSKAELERRGVSFADCLTAEEDYLA